MSQTTLMESGARPCVDCCGEGVVSVRPDDCDHAGLNCPCDSAEETCARCGGSKVEACDFCGEPSTLRYLAQDLCSSCAPSEDYRFDSCSICDAPIDVRESRNPLCPRCESTARAAGEYAAEATRYEQERRAS